MMPSNASTISSRLSTACGFSILAMTGQPHALLVHDLRARRRCRRRTRTNDSAIMSAPEAQPPAQVGLVLLGHGRDADRDAGQVDALVVGDHAALDAPSVTTLGRRRPRPPAAPTLPSSIRSRSPGRDVAGQPLVRRADPVLRRRGRRRVVMVKRSPSLEPRPGRRRTGRAGSSGPAGRRGCRRRDRSRRGRAHVAVDLLVVGVAAVAEVQPGHVHAGVDERADALRARRRRARGCRRSWRDAWPSTLDRRSRTRVTAAHAGRVTRVSRP